MNKEIINKFLEKSLQYLESAEAFAKEQVPGFIEEVLRYYAIVNMTYLIVAIVIFTMYVIWARKTYTHYEDTTLNFAKSLIYGSFAFVSLVVIGNFGQLLKPLIAPRLYLIEWLKRML